MSETAKNYLSYSVISEQLRFLSNNTSNLIVPVLVDTFPVMLLSKRPYFLCIYSDNSSRPSELKLGYASIVKYNNIAIKEIPFSLLEGIVLKQSFTTAVKSIAYDENSVEQSSFFVNIGRSKIGSINFTTSHATKLEELLESNLQGLTDNEHDDVISYCIERQSALDAYLHVADNMSDSYKSASVLNGVCFSNFKLKTGETNLDILSRVKGLKLYDLKVDDIDACKLMLAETQVRFTNLYASDDSYLGSTLIFNDASFNLVAMAVAKDDYGINSISGLERYQVTKNEYLICLICNDCLYRNLFKNRMHTIYNSKYDAVEMCEGITSMSRNADGKITFKEILTGHTLSRKGDNSA